MVRYRFSEFTLSPQQRLLLRNGREVPLIPRYFDLLLLLIERRREAVHRREIFDRVWADVIVSDSALSQAVRSIRRTLEDDSREPRFIRTVSRHGYQFVFPDVVEEDEPSIPGRPASAATVEQSVENTTKLLVREEHSPSLRQALRFAGLRWSRASAGAALAGLAAGGFGGLILAAAPESVAPIAIAPVLAVIGGSCGALAGAAVGAGLAFAEAAAPSRRTVALPLAGAVAGSVVGFAVQWLTRWALAALVGVHVDVGGGLEGILIGVAAGIGFAAATRSTPDVLWVPRGGTRLPTVLAIAFCCGVAGLALTLTGRPLVGGTIHRIADTAHGSSATLAPLGRLIGEPDFGPVSSGILAFGEAAVFGCGLAFGLVRRPRPRTE